MLENLCQMVYHFAPQTVLSFKASNSQDNFVFIFIKFTDNSLFSSHLVTDYSALFLCIVAFLSRIFTIL